jgi:hypothetical protein
MPSPRLPHEVVQLREETLAWLRDLHPDDLQDLDDSIAFQRWWRTVSRFMKWLLLTFVAMILAGASLGDAFLKFKGWFFFK